MSRRDLAGGARQLSVSFTRKLSTGSLTEISKHSAKANEEPTPDDDGKPISDDILAQSLALTNLIFGIYAIELWHYDESSGKLVNVTLGSHDEEIGSYGGGLLVKRPTQETDIDNDYFTSSALAAYNKLTDRSLDDYLPAESLDPGVGLPGVLWAESSSASGGGFGNLRLHGHHGDGHGHDSILWRDVVEFANDPDQPYDERLQTFAKAGFKLAAGIPFDTNGYRGIVIYFANPYAQYEKLRDPVNSRFMNGAAQLIGAAASIQGQMGQIKEFREKVSYDNWHRMKIKLLTIVRFMGTLRWEEKRQAGMVDDSSSKLKRKPILEKFREASVRFKKDAKKTIIEVKDSAQMKLSRWGKKVQGGSAGIPPSFGWDQTLWTFIGVMTTHTILSRVNLLVKTESDQQLSLILAPLGALTTLQYNLTAAPASQPRNAIFAQAFAITVAILLSYIPNVEPWFRSALAPAIIIPAMAKLGIIHPPAGATAIVFSSGKVRWEHMGIFLAGVAISIITAVGINNMSDKRQYPTSWFLLNKAKRKLTK